MSEQDPQDQDEDDGPGIRRAMLLMRDKERVVKIPRERGHLLIEAKTGGELLEPQNDVDHYVVRWRGDDILPTYWKERNPLAIKAELAKTESIEILRKDDVDLDL